MIDTFDSDLDLNVMRRAASPMERHVWSKRVECFDARVYAVAGREVCDMTPLDWQRAATWAEREREDIDDRKRDGHAAVEKLKDLDAWMLKQYESVPRQGFLQSVLEMTRSWRP